jgi:hypothetical protein
MDVLYKRTNSQYWNNKKGKKIPMKSSLRKMFGMIVICAILLAACGRKDPLNRQTAYFEITEGCGGEVYGVRETYRANTTVTRNQFLDQEEDVVKALKDYIETSLPKEKVGILLYEEMPQEDGYELTVFYQSLVAKEYDKDIDCDIDKCYCLTISVNENENVEIFKLLSLAAK